MAKEAPSAQEVRLTLVAANTVFQCLRDMPWKFGFHLQKYEKSLTVFHNCMKTKSKYYGTWWHSSTFGLKTLQHLDYIFLLSDHQNVCCKSFQVLQKFFKYSLKIFQKKLKITRFLRRSDYCKEKLSDNCDSSRTDSHVFHFFLPLIWWSRKTKKTLQDFLRLRKFKGSLKLKTIILCVCQNYRMFRFNNCDKLYVKHKLQQTHLESLFIPVKQRTSGTSHLKNFT